MLILSIIVTYLLNFVHHGIEHDVVSTYGVCIYDCMLLSCHVRVSEWIYTP